MHIIAIRGVCNKGWELIDVKKCPKDEGDLNQKEKITILNGVSKDFNHAHDECCNCGNIIHIIIIPTKIAHFFHFN